MKALRVDFAPPSVSRSLLRMKAGSLLLLGAGIALLLSACITAFDLRAQQQLVQTDVLDLQAKLARHTSRPAAMKTSITPLQARAINQAIAQLNLPWPDLLDTIEDATPPSIALLALEPDGKNHVLKGLGEAKTADAMLAYIENLKRQPFFDSVVLLKHEVNEQDPNKPLRFQFQARWMGAKS